MSKQIGWQRYGGYECSSRGDRRFSAFYAVVDGRTIEDRYQTDVKGYPNARAGKGQPPLRCTREEAWQQYLALWQRWAQQHPDALRDLRQHAAQHNGLLSDMFATSHVNQARALAIILNEEEEA